MSTRQIRPPAIFSNKDKDQFKTKVQETIVSQEDILNKLQVNSSKQVIDSFVDKYSETLNNLETNELESRLHSTLDVLEEEYARLVKIQQSSQSDLERLKKVLSDETKKQQLYFTQSLLSNSSNTSRNSLPEEVVSKAQKSIELKISQLSLQKQLASLKMSLQPYESIPHTIEKARDRVKQLEQENRDIQEQLDAKVNNTSLNDSTDEF